MRSIPHHFIPLLLGRLFASVKMVRGVTNEQRRRRDPFLANPLGRGELADFLSGGRRALCLLLMT